MPLPGGATDKYGNRYELRWTVLKILDVMDENADSIRIEPVGPEGEGVEFWIKKGDSIEYHQVKRQNTQGGWSIAALGSKNILSTFYKKFEDKSASCVFISALGAGQLEELTDRARRAKSYEEFEQHFIKDTGNKANFEDLRNRWGNCSKEVVYDYLSRLYINTIGEDLLRIFITTRLSSLVEGESSNIESELIKYILDSVHKELNSIDIWNYLVSKGFKRRQWGSDQSVLQSVELNNERYLLHSRNSLVAGKTIPREETKQILSRIKKVDEMKCFVLSGDAGAGKSSILLQVVENVKSNNWPLLCFRVDRLDPTVLPADVGKQLGLPNSPVSVLASIAKGRDCLLVIDQLDAVSLASGRNTSFFQTIEELINQTKVYPNMKVIIACRKFDLENDSRFRRLVGKNAVAHEIAVKRLGEEQIELVIKDLGLDPVVLTPKLFELFSIPLHLSLLSEIPVDSISKLKTSNDLYDLFWDRKQELVREKVSSYEWTEVINTLCEYMSNRQVLFAPKNIIDRYTETAKIMTSEQILIYDGKKYAFFHEGFFDYCFARNFVGRGNKLITLLLSGEQYLFRRGQVRQILFYERILEFEEYMKDLEEILTHSNIRFHLKQAVLAMLGLIEDPTEQEIRIISNLLNDGEEAIQNEIWSMLNISRSWVVLLDSLGLLVKWLEESRYMDQVFNLLISVQGYIPDRISEILSPYIDKSPEWNTRLISLMRRSKLHKSRVFFDFFLQLIDRGIMDDAKGIAINSNFWSIPFPLHKHNPKWSCEVIGHYLERILKKSIQNGETNPFNINFSDVSVNGQFIITSAKEAPEEFIKQIIPFVLKVIELNAFKEGEKPIRDPIWSAIYYPGNTQGLDDCILMGLEIALKQMSLERPEEFRQIINKYKNYNFYTIQYLIIRGYTGNGKTFADDAVDYLLSDYNRFKTGYINNGYWATRMLIEEITPFCSKDKLEELEEAIMNYYPDWEKTARGYQSFGYAQFTLLEGILKERISAKGTKKIEQWRRKFRITTPKSPESIEFKEVRSPISVDITNKMSDQQWISAIEKYNKDDLYSQNRGFFGGALQLSRVLETEVNKDPKRFANLLLKFREGTHSYYFNAILNGLEHVDLDIETLQLICQRCHSLPGRPCGKAISKLLINNSRKLLPTDLLDIVAWYATEDPDPEKEWWRTKTDNGDDVYYGGNIIDAAINSTRGIAVEAIGMLIFYGKDRVSYFKNTLNVVTKDKSIAVRSSVARTLTLLLEHDRDLAVNLFKELYDTEEILLETEYVEEFLFFSLRSHYKYLEKILIQMMNSDIHSVARAGSRQLCVASLVMNNERLDEFAYLCLTGSRHLRMGAAQVFTKNLSSGVFGEKSKAALKLLFNDEDEEVLSEVSGCWKYFEGDQLGKNIDLINSFIDSGAFIHNCYELITALKETEAKLPEVTLRVGEKFVGSHLLEDDKRIYSTWEAQELSEIIIRLYSQSSGDFREKCLNLIDRMLMLQTYGINDTISSFDR